MKFARPLGVLALNAPLFVAGFHLAIGDELLFHSDALSLGVYIAAAGLMLTLAAGVAALVLRVLLPRTWRSRVYRAFALITAVGIVTIFLMLALDYLASAFEIAQLKRLARHQVYFVLVSLLPAAAAVLIPKGRLAVVGRIEVLGLVIIVGVLAVLGGRVLAAWNDGVARAGDTGGRHLLLIVLDGMPGHYFRAFNSERPRGPADDALAEGLIYTRTYTATPWTNGYFGILYTGKQEFIRDGAGILRPSPSIFGPLESAGIGLRWLAYHRNGVPEGSAAQASNYRGLRSYLLTEGYSWIPELLGLDYHVTLSGRGMSQNLTSATAESIYDWINPVKNYQTGNTFTDTLLPELRRLRLRHHNSFLIFHQGWQLSGAESLDVPLLPAAQKSMQGTEASEAVTRIHGQEYQYEPALEPLAQLHRERAAQRVAILGRHLAEFLRALEADERLRDTVVILTADHGTMYRKGRFWYGYHPNEEVVRVPLAVFNAGRSGTDARPFTTRDLTRTILEFFGLDGGAIPGALSILGEGTRDSVASLTLRSNRYNEWFLILHQGDLKYRMNLHPDGDGRAALLSIEGYDERIVAETVGPPDQLRAAVRDAIAGYGLRPEQIHPAYR